MVTMTPDGKWCSVEEACGIAGCTDGLIRLRLREGRLEGFKANDRAWLVSVEAAKALRSSLAPHANVHKDTPAQPRRKRRKAR